MKRIVICCLGVWLAGVGQASRDPRNPNRAPTWCRFMVTTTA